MAQFAPLHPPSAKPLSRRTHLLPSRLHQICACSTPHVQRRSVAFGFGGVVLGLSLGAGNARGAARRPPPPPPAQKEDPNVSGLAAKVLASKKRKQAMKESVAKLREKGKPIQEPSP